MSDLTSVRVPNDRSMLTPEWLTSALRHGGHLQDASVTALDVQEIGIGRGYVCLTVRLTPTYDRPVPGAPATIVAKIPNFVAWPDEASRLLVEELCAAEVHWYRDLAPDCPVRVPQCYWAGVDPTNAATTLLLEDLGDLRMIDQSTGASAAEAEMAVANLARIHARWWEKRDLVKLPWLRDAQYVGEIWQSRYAPGWLAAQRILAGKLPPAFDPVGTALCTQMSSTFREAAASASTLVHGDYRAENFMFGPAGGPDEFCVLDWQIASWGSGLIDLGYFIGQSMTVDVRRSVEERLLRRYYDSLVAEGVKGYTFERFMDDYRRGLLTSTGIAFQAFALLEGMIAVGPGDVDEEQRKLWQQYMDSGVALIEVMAVRSAVAILDNDAGRMFKA